MLLRLEERIKVPKRAFDVLIRWHFREAHLEENLAKLLANFEQRV